MEPMKKIFGLKTMKDSPDIFRKDPDGTILKYYESGEHSGWTKDWSGISESAPKFTSVSGVVTNGNYLWLFGIGKDDNILYWNHRNYTGPWSGWLAKGPDSSKAPNLGSVFAIEPIVTNGEFFVFGIGKDDNTLYMKRRSPALSWDGWLPDWSGTSESAPKLTSVSGIVGGDNLLHVFGIGKDDNTLYMNHRDAEKKWSGWLKNWSGTSESAPKLASVSGVVTNGNYLWLFGIGKDDNILYMNHRNATGPWTGWLAKGPALTNAPKLRSVFAIEPPVTNGEFYVFGIGKDDNTLYMNHRSPGFTWEGWLPYWSGTSAQAPKLTSVSGVVGTGNMLFIFGTGTDNMHYLNWRDSGSGKQGQWSGWIPDWNRRPGTLIGYKVPLQFPLGWLDHTYVKCCDDYSWNCWGRQEGGTEICSGSGYPVIADCIAQPQPPEAAFIPSGECAGLKNYLIDGVCHQAANRVLWPAGKIVSDAGGYWLSSALYGTYGRDASEWVERKTRCSGGSVGSVGSRIDEGDSALKAYLDKVVGLHVKHLKDVAGSPGSVGAVLEEEFRLTVEYRMGEAPARMAELCDAQKKLLSDKAKKDDLFISKKITSDEFAREINDIVNGFSKQCSDLLGEESYIRLFGEKPLNK